ncbi:MAG: hypothetical protein ACRDHG_08935, partial [Anaerolineales bacterium]
MASPTRPDHYENLLAVVDRIARRRYFGAIGLLIGYRLLASGLGSVPREPYRLTALDPFVRVSAYPQNYFQRSPLLPLVGHFTGLTTPLGFAGLSLAIVVTGWLLFAALVRRDRGNEVALLSFALVLAHPVSLVLISWLGTPDGITFTLTSLLFFTRSTSVIAVICALGA